MPVRESRARDFESLWRAWTKEHRGQGGWWALAGFSYEFLVYLVRFFEGVIDGAREPGELAQIELASDVMTVRDGNYVLTQVKRTLALRSQLRTALREAYDLAALCEPELLERITFQIACVKRTTALGPADLTLAEVVESGGDPVLWSRVIARFDPHPIVEEPDPLGRLYHVLFYRAGLRDPARFIDTALGTLLRLFENPGPDTIADIGRRLASSLHEARTFSHDPPPAIGTTLRRELVAVREDAAEDRAIVFRRPRADDLALARFRKRPVFDALIRAFETWSETIAALDEPQKIPIFWIDGRSGEGKSVLLLQLAQNLLLENALPHRPDPVVSVIAPDQLSHWIANERALQETASAGVPPVFALVDDLYRIDDLERLHRELRAATDIAMPRVAVLACGPTPERIAFEAGLRDVVDIHPFHVPNLEDQEREAFRTWYIERTGQSVTLDESSQANRTLVIWMFELLQRRSLDTFAANFRERLSASGLFDVARAILAANALELLAPTQLVERLDGKQFDAFRQLCDNEQLHFEKARVRGTVGYRLAHPQIDWRLYCEWTPAPSLPRQFGRDLAVLLEANAERRAWPACRDIISRLGQTTRLSNSALGTSGEAWHQVDEALGELYRNQQLTIGSGLSANLLPGWLAQCLRRPQLSLSPDPIDDALDLCSDPGAAAKANPSIAALLWRLSESKRLAHRSDAMRAAARSLVLSSPARQGVGQAVASIRNEATDKAAATALAREWLQTTANDESYLVLAAIVRGRDEADVRDALRRLESDRKKDRAWPLLTALVRAMPRDPAVISTAESWLRSAARRDQAGQLFAALIHARPHDEQLAGEGLAWIAADANARAPKLLGSMLRTRRWDDRAVDAAREWLRSNPHHDRTGYLAESLLVARPGDPVAVRGALRWLQTAPVSEQSAQLLASLISLNPENDTVADGALAWIVAHAEHPKAWMVASLLAARDGGAEGTRSYDAPVIAAIRRWVEANPNHAHTHDVLHSLARSSSRPDDVASLIERWLDQGPGGLTSSRVVRALIGAHPNSAGALRLTVRWLEREAPRSKAHGDQANAVLSSLVTLRADDPDVIRIALAWVAERPSNKRPIEVLGSLLAAHPDDDAIYGAALEYLEIGKDAKEIPRMLAPLLARCPHDDRLVEVALRWIDRFPERGQAPRLLSELALQRARDNQDVLRAAERWLETRRDVVPSVLLPLVEARPADEGVFALALRALRQPQHAVCYPLLLRLLEPRNWNGEPISDGAVAAAARWLSENPSFDRAHIIHDALVRARPADEAITRSARVWLEANSDHPSARRLIRTLLYHRCDADILRIVGLRLREEPYRPRRLWLLRHLIGARPVDSDAMSTADLALHGWLAANRGSDGYRMALISLQKHPGRWAALTSRVAVEPEIVEDYGSLPPLTGEPAPLTPSWARRRL